MTSIARTAYPQFKRLTSARVLHVFFTPTADEIDWAQERAAGPGPLLAVVLALKCFQKMARFPSRQEIPEVVVDHVRRCLGLAEDVEPDHGASRTAKWHRTQIRARQGVIYDERARAIAAEAMGEAALARNNPPDLINVALERLIEASLELTATSRDDSVLAALDHARAHEAKRRDFIPMPPRVEGSDDPESGIMFASGNWRRAVTDRGRPGMVARRGADRHRR